MKLLGIDIGTTHCKAGLFDENGAAIRIAGRKTATHRSEQGYYYYDPEEIWGTVASAIKEVIADADAADVAAVGIASMAESGLLVDTQSGKSRSPFIPWFDTCSMKEAEEIAGETEALERFSRSGLHNSFKYGLPKLLWLRKQYGDLTKGAVWLSASDYIAYRLTGNMATDYSLAARTYAFRIDKKEWDAEWIRHFGFDPALFPAALPSGTPLGAVRPDAGVLTGLAAGTRVAVAGHDHVAASLAVGAVRPGNVYDSMGTAETLVGTMEEGTLGRQEFASGLSYGCHAAKGRMFWMGGISASGGSVEWIRAQIGETLLSYEQILELLSKVEHKPTGILYFPYLSGSGAPLPDPKAKGAFVGLQKSHTRGDLVQAVLEGTAYQMEFIRRSAEQATGTKIDKILAVGGGTRNRFWIQAKADVSGCRMDISSVSEATLLGAALSAGVGCGLYADAEEAAAAAAQSAQVQTVWPDAERHRRYRTLYEQGFLPLQEPLRQFYKI